MDGSAAMCVTFYASKDTQAEDSAPHHKAMKVIARRIEKQAAETEAETVELPRREGLKRLLGAVMAACGCIFMMAQNK